ncbi:MAG: hypothetical protein ACLGI5_12725 [Thermoleophilia bacterium]
MTRRGTMPAAALGAVLVLLAAVTAGPTPATADQASQPGFVAAGWLDAGRYHTCAVVPVGDLRCWGYGGDGSLGYANTATIGDDETPASAGPVDVGAGRSVQAVSAGTVHTCALLDDGAVRCWGFGGNGRLGYGNLNDVGEDEPPAAAGPVDLGPGRSAKVISAGRAHTCAVLDDDSVRCWGFNFDGRLGYGFTDSIGDDEAPGSVAPVRLGPDRTAATITSGDSHTCAILDDGNVRCWGLGTQGQLGYGSVGMVGDDETPDLIGPVDLGAGRTAVAIAAGDFHNCAILDDGAVRCWGYGGNGRLGYAGTDSIGDDETPGSVGPVALGPGRTARAITAGDHHSCALLDDGSVRCWGQSESGQLGYGNRDAIGDDETPASAGPVDLGAGRTAVALAAGGNHTCARLDDDSVRCWGRGTYGELGHCAVRSIGDDESPASVGPVDLGVAGVPAAGCAPVVVAPPPPPPAAPFATPPPAPGQPAAPPPPAAADPLTVGLRAQAERAAALRACRSSVRRRAREARSRARRLRHRPARVRALRSASRQAVLRRRACLARFARRPGRVTTLRARPASSRRGAVVLRFKAPGTDRSRPPAARGYVVRQSRRPIRSARDFTRAQTLCRGTCRFAVRTPGAEIMLTITDLRRRTTYHYAVAARDNVSGRLGPRSKTVAVRTR